MEIWRRSPRAYLLGPLFGVCFRTSAFTVLNIQITLSPPLVQKSLNVEQFNRQPCECSQLIKKNNNANLSFQSDPESQRCVTNADGVFSPEVFQQCDLVG